ncbi:hypothetical protein ABPG74_008338 [Tetrahymena malaccensis]
MSSELHSNQKLLAYTLGGFLAGAGSLLLFKKLVCRPRNQPGQCPFTGKRKQQVITQRFACIELGGTSIRLAIGIKETHPDGTQTCKFDQESFKTIETKEPEDNIQQIKEYFENQNIDSVGIASFGPICLDETSEQYGYITTTPKVSWKNFPLLKRVSEVIPHRKNQRIGFDTDVNAAACAEYNFGNHKAKKSLAYITVGTGVGVGLIVDGKCVHGLTHPEGGHVLIKPAQGETFQGVCKSHGNCVEGMVTNHAIAEKLNTNINELSKIEDSHEIWDSVAYYLAQLCLNLTLISSPEVIVIGGGIMNRQPLLSLIKQNFIKLLNQYVDHPRLSSNIDDYIVKPFFSDSGLVGSMVV